MVELAELFGLKFCIDSRDIKEGDVFVALQGQKNHGHDFAAQALELGAKYIIIEKDLGLQRQIICKSSLKFIQDLARQKAVFMQDKGVKIVGITGSVGKTTTKDLVHHMLQHIGLEVYKANGSFNNHIGVPLTILCAPLDIDVLVSEIGMNHKGEINNLVKIIQPDIRVITAIGHAHIENFGSLKNIAEAKAEIFNNSKSNQIAIINQDSPEVEILSQAAYQNHLEIIYTSVNAEIKKFEICTSSTKFEIVGYDIDIERPVGKNWLNCLLVGLKVCEKLGYNADRVLQNYNFNSFFTNKSPSRGDISELTIGERKIRLVDESYNSSIESLKEMLGIAKSLKGRSLIVIGDMKEIGDYAGYIYEEMKNSLNFECDTIFVGINTTILLEAKYYQNVEDLIECFDLSLLKNIDNIFIKGSRSVGLDRFVKHLQSCFASK